MKENEWTEDVFDTVEGCVQHVNAEQWYEFLLEAGTIVRWVEDVHER